MRVTPSSLEELLRGWLETGALLQKGQGWTLASSVAPMLPPSIVSAVRQRLTRLAPEVVDLLCTAAIVGRTFDLALLAEVAGQEPEPVEERLREVVQARLIRPGQAGTFTFSHDRIRECLYGEVTTVRRRRLHGFIGRALEARPEPASAQWLAELAFHFARSGDRERGGSCALRAAEHAMRAYAADEALGHYRAALDLVDATDVRRGALLFGLGEAAVLAGAEGEAVAAFEAAQTWFERAADPVGAARAAHCLGQAWWRQEAIPEARAACEAALALLERHPGPELVRVLVDLGSLLAVSLHQQTAGLAYSRLALGLAQQLADECLIAAASRSLGNLLVRSNDLAAGIPFLERALALATAAHDPVEAAEDCACLTVAYFWQGAFRRCSDVLVQRLEFARRCHDPYQLRHVYTWLAMVHWFQGGFGQAEQLLDQAQAIVERLASREPMAYLHLGRGGLAHWRGNYAAAEASLREAMAIFREIGPSALVWYLGLLGLNLVTPGEGTRGPGLPGRAGDAARGPSRGHDADRGT